jgi:lysyl endopeptidase
VFHSLPPKSSVPVTAYRRPSSRRTLAWLLAALAVPAAAAAQEPQVPFGLTHADKLLPLSKVHLFQTPAIDAAAERAALDNRKRLPDEKPEALQFAIPFEVELDPAQAGTWETLHVSGRDYGVWRLVVRTPGAISMNLGFTRFWLPAGALLSVYAPDHKPGADGARLRQFTERDIDDHGQLWMPIVPRTDTVVVELKVDEGRRDQVKLTLGAINGGFRPLSDILGVSGSCNVDVACPQGDPYRDEIRAVGVLQRGGSRVCSGSLINNTGGRRPLFITADHCGVRANNAATVVAYWNFQNSTCRPPNSGSSGSDGDGNLNQFNSGSIFLATFATSDFTLVELDDAPQQSFNVFLAGWNRNPGPFTDGAVGIHHPAVAEKRISISNRATEDDGGTHHRIWWRPNGIGVTEGGSSGSPIYDKQGRFIGQLTGGGSACGVPDSSMWDVYGKLSRSWDGGGSATTRVRDYLNPAGGTAPLTIDGRNWNDGGGDTTPPTTALTAPAAGATVSGTVSVTANASDNVAVARVDFLVDGNLAGSDTTAPYSFSWNTTSVANGSHTLQSRAVDTSNNVGQSAARTVTVNNVGGNAIVQLFQHCNFTGWQANFTAAGSFSTAQIVAAGGVNNDASSIRVAAGFRVVLFDGDGQTGSSVVVTGDTACFVGLNFNDVLSSLRIEPVTPGGNLALNKPATGSTPCNANEGPAKAVNGSVSGGNSDKWCSHTVPRFLQVDLGSNTTVGGFVIKHAGAGGESTTFNTRAYTIQVGPDVNNLTTVVTVTANTASITRHTIAARSARIVRLNVTTPTQNTNTGARIYELEVYAGAPPAAPAGGADRK